MTGPTCVLVRRGAVRFPRLLHAIFAAGAACVLCIHIGSAAAAPPPGSVGDGEPLSYVRVLSAEVEVRSGPTIGARVIALVAHGEPLRLRRRASGGFWLQIELPDGREGYVVGDQVQPYDEDQATGSGPLLRAPLQGAAAGVALLGGVLRTPVAGSGPRIWGYMEVKPSVIVHSAVTLDGYLGMGLTSEGKHVLYGVGASVYFAPTWRISPFFSLAGCGLSVLPNADNFVLRTQYSYAARAGAGLAFAFKGRVVGQLSGHNLTVFTPQRARQVQLIVLGLGAYF